MDMHMNLDAIQKALKSERFLDGPVCEYKPKTVGTKLNLGTSSTLREYYSKYLLDVPGSIIVGSVKITTSPEVMAVLKAVLYTGCCRIEERSYACREVFMRACKGGQHLGISELISTFEEHPTNPFVTVVQDTIKELLGVG